MQVVGAVGFAKQHLALPPELDERVTRLIRACWAPQPADRPSFAQILEQLKEFRGELPAAVQASSAGSGSQRADSGTTGGTGDVLSLGGGDMAAAAGSPPLDTGSDMLPAAAGPAPAAGEGYAGPVALQTPAPPPPAAAAVAGGGARSYMAPAASLPIPRLPPPPMPGAGSGQAAALARIAPAASPPLPGALQRSGSSGSGGAGGSGVAGAGAGALQVPAAGGAASKARSSGGGGSTVGDAAQAGSSLDGPPTAPLIEI
jgi:DNA polymerase-3 subunit gamma/tau